MVETIELEFNAEEARVILYAGTGIIKLRGDNRRVVILHWTEKGELTKDQISRYDLIIEGEL